MEDFVRHKPLSETCAFWVVLVVPVFLAVIVGGLIYYNSQLGDLCLTSGCVNYFVELYKVPLAIAGLSLPLVAVVAAVQRSKEAFLQIQVGQRQYAEAVSNNRFGNYLKHRDSFYKLISNFCEDKGDESYGRTKIDSDLLYVRMFPNDKIDNPNWWMGSEEGYWKILGASFVELSKCIEKAFGAHDKLDVESFLRLTKVITSSLMLNYEPSRIVSDERVKGISKNHFTAKNLSDDSLAIYFTLREALHLFNAISAYAGRNDNAGKVDAFYKDEAVALIESNISKFKVSAHNIKIA